MDDNKSLKYILCNNKNKSIYELSNINLISKKDLLNMSFCLPLNTNFNSLNEEVCFSIIRTNITDWKIINKSESILNIVINNSNNNSKELKIIDKRLNKNEAFRPFNILNLRFYYLNGEDKIGEFYIQEDKRNFVDLPLSNINYDNMINNNLDELESLFQDNNNSGNTVNKENIYKQNNSISNSNNNNFKENKNGQEFSNGENYSKQGCTIIEGNLFNLFNKYASKKDEQETSWSSKIKYSNNSSNSKAKTQITTAETTNNIKQAEDYLNLASKSYYRANNINKQNQEDNNQLKIYKNKVIMEDEETLFDSKENIQTVNKLQSNDIEELIKIYNNGQKFNLETALMSNKTPVKENLQKYGLFNSYGKRMLDSAEELKGYKTKRLKKCTENRTFILDSNTTCSICLELIKHDNHGHLFSCKHDFCLSCIKEWSKKTNLCPLCKKEFKIINYFEGNNKKELKVKKKRLNLQNDDFYFEQIDDTNDNCLICFQSDRPDLLLVCDRCQFNVCHTYCDNLSEVPLGEWNCRPCRDQIMRETLMSSFLNENFELDSNENNGSNEVEDRAEDEVLKELEELSKEIEERRINESNNFSNLNNIDNNFNDITCEINEESIDKSKTRRNKKRKNSEIKINSNIQSNELNEAFDITDNDIQNKKHKKIINDDDDIEFSKNNSNNYNSNISLKTCSTKRSIFRVTKVKNDIEVSNKNISQKPNKVIFDDESETEICLNNNNNNLNNDMFNAKDI